MDSLSDVSRSICKQHPKVVEFTAKVAPNIVGNVVSFATGSGTAGALASTGTSVVAAIAPELVAELAVGGAIALACDLAAGLAAGIIVVAAPVVIVYEVGKRLIAVGDSLGLGEPRLTASRR